MLTLPAAREWPASVADIFIFRGKALSVRGLGHRLAGRPIREFAGAAGERW